MYISKVHIKNYRCIDEVEIKFNKGMNSLVGKNGTGKTVVLEAIKAVVFQRRDVLVPGYISLEISDNDGEILQMFSTLIKNMKIPERKKALFENFFRPKNGGMLTCKIVKERRDNAYRDYLKIGELVFYNVHVGFEDVFSQENMVAISLERMNAQEFDSAITLLNLVALVTEKNQLMRLEVDYLSHLVKLLQKKVFFVGEMRDLRKENVSGIASSRQPDDQSFDAEEIHLQRLEPSTYIDRFFRLQNSMEPRDYEVKDNFKKKCREDGYEVDAITEQRNQIKLRIRDLHTGSITDNSRFPSGLMQKLFFYFVETIANGKILLLEEPENNLHPGLQKELTRLLGEINQIILTTHSPEFIDLESLGSVSRLALQENKTLIFSSEKKKPSNVHYFDKNCFFSDFVIVVEGETEVYMVPILFDLVLDKIDFLNRNNMLVLNAGGEGKVASCANFLGEFGIPKISVKDIEGKTLPELKEKEDRFEMLSDFDCLYKQTIKYELDYSDKDKNKRKAQFAIKVLKKIDELKKDGKTSEEILKYVFDEKHVPELKKFVNYVKGSCEAANKTTNIEASDGEEMTSTSAPRPPR
ncbi:AAA family ATPase [Candidatus Micrarchaeota archaeon]|nr:AAA family ATPase [Candidatus Micrarchaeota archaeon]